MSDNYQFIFLPNYEVINTYYEEFNTLSCFNYEEFNTFYEFGFYNS
jgi:hypothetical protein